MAVERVLFPFEPNWARPYQVAFSFKTDIFVSRSGGEQRRAIRQNPRKTISFSCLIDDERLRRFNRLMHVAQNLPFIMPEVTRSVDITGVAGAVVSLAVAAPAWVAVGTEVILKNEEAMHVASVASIGSGRLSVTLSVAPGSTWATLHPSLTGELNADTSAPRVTSNAANCSVQFEVEPGCEILTAPAATSSFNGIPVFDIAPNWSTDIETNHVWPVQKVDFDVGRITTHRPVDFPTQLRKWPFLAFSRTEADAIRDWFIRCKGQRSAFYAATLENDLPPVASFMADDDTFVVAGTAVFDAHADDPVNTAIEVRLNDGTTMRFNLLGMVVLDDTTVIQIDGTWPADIAVAAVERISWLNLCRFATDELTIEWVTDEIARAQLPIRTLPTVNRADYLAQRATLQGDDRETVAGDDRVVVYFDRI